MGLTVKTVVVILVITVATVVAIAAILAKNDKVEAEAIPEDTDLPVLGVGIWNKVITLFSLAKPHYFFL